MNHKCSNCGFRSRDTTFFRREKGGLLNRPKVVCDLCVPYRPSPFERRMGLNVLFAPAGFLLGAFPVLFHNTGIFLLVMAVISVLTLPLRILIHEAGHAFSARLLGQIVSQARIGSGPVRRRLRVAGVNFEIRAYPWMGGIVKFFDPHGSIPRGAKAFIIAAGPLANLLTAAIALDLSYWCQDVGIIAAALAGFGLFNGLIAITNLIPRRFGDNETVPSDGRQLLNMLKPGEPPNPLLLQIYHATEYSYMGRYDDAVAAAKANEQWHTTPLKLFFAIQIFHNLSRGQGERAALDFYFAHQNEFQDPDNVGADALSSLPWIQANVAWSALKLGDPELAELAARMAEAAIAAVPDNPEIVGTYGAWLVSVGRGGEGLPFLVRAARAIGNNIDKADFCRFIASGRYQQGDATRAETYTALEAHIRTLP